MSSYLNKYMVRRETSSLQQMPTNKSRRNDGVRTSRRDATVVRKKFRNRILTQSQNISPQISCNLQLIKRKAVTLWWRKHLAK